MRVTIDGSPKEIAVLVAELQRRRTGEIEIELDGRKVTEAVVQTIRGKCAGNT